MRVPMAVDSDYGTLKPEVRRLERRVAELERALRFALSEGAGFACPESTEKLLLEALNGSARRVLGNE